MPEIAKQTPDNVAETLLFTLYVRALESQRPDALLKDTKAVALLDQLAGDIARLKRVKMDEEDRVTLILRNRQFDRQARGFLARFPESVVVHLGSGFDSRFERVDNGKVEWYDLDVPEVITLRRKFIGEEGPRYHLLAYSAFDPAWLDIVAAQSARPILVLAEGVFMYFKESQIRSLVLRLLERFPGSELVFDGFLPYLVRMNNLRMRFGGVGARYYWGIKHGKDLEGWGKGIQLLDEWFPLDQPEPRLARVQWMRSIPFLARVMGIFHYRLGESSN
ncbi:MAG TPA: class I SAM-dependent methyltransferase [Anaerolineales bacterium]|nr:class I SAM-dependent methyltransferase [Anaerolineales bacterium]